jgi:hypothetical protein
LTGTRQPLSAAEFMLWMQYRQQYGFVADRLEAATAIAGAAVCRAWGAKVDPSNLLPRFGPRRVLKGSDLVAALSNVRGVSVTTFKVPRKA